MTESVSMSCKNNDAVVADGLKQSAPSYSQSSYDGESWNGTPMTSQRRFTYGDIDDLFRTDLGEPCAASTCSSREVLELIRRQKRKEQNRAAYGTLP